MTSQTMQKALKAHVDFFAAHAQELRLWLPLWRLLTEGKPVRLPRLAGVSHRSLDELQAALPSLDVRLDQEGNVLASGVSLLPTAHQFHLGEQVLYTWCALDTLLLPPLLGRAAHVVSPCPVTGKAIRLMVTPKAALDLSPVDAVVSVHLPGEETNLCHVQEDICNDGFFFVSRDVASAWPRLHPQAVLLTVEEVAQLGRELASTLLSLAGEPDHQEANQ